MRIRTRTDATGLSQQPVHLAAGDSKQLRRGPGVAATRLDRVAYEAEPCRTERARAVGVDAVPVADVLKGALHRFGGDVAVRTVECGAH
jgi:hypothetical protein